MAAADQLLPALMLEPTDAGCSWRAFLKGSEYGSTLHHLAAAGPGGQAHCANDAAWEEEVCCEWL